MAMKAATKEKVDQSLTSIVNDTSKHTSTTITPQQNLNTPMTSQIKTWPKHTPFNIVTVTPIITELVCSTPYVACGWLDSQSFVPKL